MKAAVFYGPKDFRVENIEVLKPGDAVYYDSTQPHLVKSATRAKTTILAVLYTGAK